MLLNLVQKLCGLDFFSTRARIFGNIRLYWCWAWRSNLSQLPDAKRL